MIVRPEILSGLFTNLAAGWFALILISPQTSSLLAPLFGGIISLTIAELLLRLKENDLS